MVCKMDTTLGHSRKRSSALVPQFVEKSSEVSGSYVLVPRMVVQLAEVSRSSFHVPQLVDQLVEVPIPCGRSWLNRCWKCRDRTQHSKLLRARGRECTVAQAHTNSSGPLHSQTGENSEDCFLVAPYCNLSREFGLAASRLF